MHWYALNPVTQCIPVLNIGLLWAFYIILRRYELVSAQDWTDSAVR
jgi:hypothetical protein